MKKIKTLLSWISNAGYNEPVFNKFRSEITYQNSKIYFLYWLYYNDFLNNFFPFYFVNF